MKKNRKIKLYRKLYPKASDFARKEYVSEYEYDPLKRGYYFGFLAGVRAFKHKLLRNAIFEEADFYRELEREILGTPTII